MDSAGGQQGGEATMSTRKEDVLVLGWWSLSELDETGRMATRCRSWKRSSTTESLRQGSGTDEVVNLVPLQGRGGRRRDRGRCNEALLDDDEVGVSGGGRGGSCGELEAVMWMQMG